VEGDNEFFSFIAQVKELTSSTRPLRLRLDLPGGVNDDMLLPQRVYGTESICGGIEYRILCVSTEVQLPLKEMIAVSAALDFVTDQGELRSVCGLITEAASGDSDGGLASYQLVLRDVLAVLEKRINTRVFRNKTEVEVVQAILDEWRYRDPTLGVCFTCELDDAFEQREYPQREFIMQYNESDAAFIRRLLKRRGIGWYVRAGSNGDGPFHTLILFNNADSLRQNSAGTIRYHRDNATEQRDTITSWSAVRSLQPGSVTLHSWDYLNPLGTGFMSAQVNSEADQGANGSGMASSLDDYAVLPPHIGHDYGDLCLLGLLRMNRHDYESKCFHGEGSVRDLCAGEYFTLSGHAEIDSHPAGERDFVVTALQVTAHNNLPKALAARVERLFARNRWMQDGSEQPWQQDVTQQVVSGPLRMHIQFTAVRRGIPIVPAYDPRVDVPQVPMQSAMVVGPADEEVYCDELGRVKIRFPATREEDHEFSGASDTDGDSAWVRVASNWAGNGPGSMSQCGTVGLPRIGSEVLIAFLGGDPDKPIIVGQLYNQQGMPPALSSAGQLPGNRYLSGIKSREIKGSGANQLRFDDTSGCINSQLASDHGVSQLNLGWLTQPIANGHGEARGEGADLRTDKAVSVRGARGVLITADASPEGKGRQLERAEMIGMNDVLQSIHTRLSELATTHFAEDADGAPLAKLIEHIRQWEKGSNTEGGAPDPAGGKPIVAVSAPAGIALASQDNVVIGAQTNADMISAGNTQLSAGRKLLMRAAQGVSLFAHKLGMQLIAASGKIVIQGQDDEIEVGAAKRLHLYSLESLLLEAPEVVIRTDGAQWTIGKGKVMSSSSGEFSMQASDFKFTRGGGGSLSLPSIRCAITSSMSSFS